MPIGFITLDHGEIPIGFVNIETDLFMINDYFIFASDLCCEIEHWTEGPADLTAELEMYLIRDREHIGDLMGAIRGESSTGLIGGIYRLYPFPEKKEGFRQNPDGYRTRDTVEPLLQQFGQIERVPVVISRPHETISIGRYRFNRDRFHEIIVYIWRGGMPSWKNGERPDYVTNMMKAVLRSEHWLFRSTMDTTRHDAGPV